MPRVNPQRFSQRIGVCLGVNVGAAQTVNPIGYHDVRCSRRETIQVPLENRPWVAWVNHGVNAVDIKRGYRVGSCSPELGDIFLLGRDIVTGPEAS